MFELSHFIPYLMLQNGHFIQLLNYSLLFQKYEEKSVLLHFVIAINIFPYVNSFILQVCRKKRTYCGLQQANRNKFL